MFVFLSHVDTVAREGQHNHKYLTQIGNLVLAANCCFTTIDYPIPLAYSFFFLPSFFLRPTKESTSISNVCTIPVTTKKVATTSWAL